jgi:hypothetical protein
MPVKVISQPMRDIELLVRLAPTPWLARLPTKDTILLQQWTVDLEIVLFGSLHH